MSRKGNGKFILGTLIGIGAGLLFAPRRGADTRKELKKKLNELLEKAKEIDIDEVTKEVEGKIAKIRAELNELDKEQAIDLAREKALKLRDDAEDLVNLAIEKGTPVLKETALDVKKKTVKVAKQIIEKLEEDDKKKKED